MNFFEVPRRNVYVIKENYSEGQVAQFAFMSDGSIHAPPSIYSLSYLEIVIFIS